MTKEEFWNLTTDEQFDILYQQAVEDCEPLDHIFNMCLQLIIVVVFLGLTLYDPFVPSKLVYIGYMCFSFRMLFNDLDKYLYVKTKIRNRVQFF